MRLSDTLDAYRADLESGDVDPDVARKKARDRFIAGFTDVHDAYVRRDELNEGLDRVERAVLGEVAA